MRDGLLILGVGNVLMTDDGVGPRLVAALRHDPRQLPERTQVVDGGTLGLALLPMLNDASAVLVLDALDTGAPAGTVTVLSGTACERALGQRLSVHQVAVADLVAAARLTGFDGTLGMVGVQPHDVGPGIGLSAPVAGALQHALRAARRVAWELALAGVG